MTGGKLEKVGAALRWEGCGQNTEPNQGCPALQPRTAKQRTPADLLLQVVAISMRSATEVPHPHRSKARANIHLEVPFLIPTDVSKGSPLLMSELVPLFKEQNTLCFLINERVKKYRNIKQNLEWNHCSVAERIPGISLQRGSLPGGRLARGPFRLFT